MVTKQKNTLKNIFIASVILVAVFFLFSADQKPAQAQWIVNDPPLLAETIRQRVTQKVTQTLKDIWKKNGSRAFQQAIRTVTYKLAQDTATWVASGGKGQKPLLFSNPGKFLKEAGDQVAGDFLVKLTDGFPIDLCSADNIKSKLAINIGLNKSLMERKYAEGDLGKPGCKLSSIKNNFAEAAQAKNFLINVSTTFEPGKSPISSSIALFEDAKLAKDKFIAAEMARRIQSGDIDGFSDLVTKYPNTPRELVEEAQREAARQALAKPPRTEDIFIDTFAVFTNTLTQKYLQKLAGGFYPFRKTSGGPDVGDLAGAGGSIKALLAAFDVFSPQRAAVIKSTGEIDLFSDMISCPPPQYQSPYNCLLSDGLQQAVQQGLTIKQALDKGLLNGNIEFPETHDPNKPNLSLLNLRKLRWLRVLPVGWELAAAKLQKFKTAMSLAAVVDCFSSSSPSCNLAPSGPAGADSLSGLVDPKWVLALPQQYCRAEGIGPVPEGEKSSSRRSWCVDLQSCIKEDGEGNCEAFGYCARERAVWQLAGEQCQERYNTCQVLRRPDGTTVGTGNTPGILGSDINKSGCTQTNAGCAWFSTSGKDKNWDENQRIYLTNLAPSCRAEDAGSREIIPLEPGTNLIRSTAAAETVKIKPYTYFTLSFSAAGAPALTVSVAGNAPLKNISFGSGADNSLSLTIPANSSGRYAATFFSQTASQAEIRFNKDSFSRVQLEEVSLADGQRAQAAMAANSNAGLAVLNVSPAGSRNPASPATAYKEYKDNRKLVFSGANNCSPEEASARKYTPMNGGEAKVARLLAGDLCPAACVGLDSYLAKPTWLEQASHTAAPYPKQDSFIAGNAKACGAAEVGCEQFTNLTTATGAEKREYYSQVRSCVLDTNPQAATFYTWEGTDTAGFQLKAWQLLKDDSGAPCNNFTRASTENPASVVCAPPGGVPACSLDERNPNCRAFLDETGREFKRDVSLVVSASSACASYRRSRDGAAWHFLAAESKQCSAAGVGCREYKGARANVAERLLFSNFENTNHGWTQLNGRAAALSGESVVAGKYSLRLNTAAVKLITANIRNTSDNTFLISFLAKKSGSANLSNIALYEGNPDTDFNGDGQVNLADFQAFEAAYGQSATGPFARFDINGNNVVDIPDFFEFAGSFGATTRGQDFDLATVKLSDDWQEYRLGPIEFSVEARAPVYILKFAGTGAIFIDNIELLASPTQFYITDSWQAKQPAACSAYNRCDAYRDDSNNTFYTSRFDKLFSDDSAYCRAVIDTQNSNSSGAESFNQGTALDNPTPTYAVAADNLEYRVIRPENLRPASAAGCTALGVPGEGASPPWKEPTYRVVDPDTFKQGSLCQAEGLGCQNFQSEAGETHVFRDPGKKLCDWNSAKNNFVKLDPTGKQTSDLCYAGRTDNHATWYVAQCPAEQGSCTAYAPTDVNLTEGVSSALFMRQDTVEPGNCKAGDGIDSGCVNFKEGYVSAPDIREDLLATSQDRLLSVKAARQCAEWLAPTTSSEVNDPKSRSVRTVVYDLGRCQELDANGRCGRWTDQTQASFPAAYKDKPSGAITKLQPNVYSDRFADGKTLFSGAWDYSGYSLPDQYPVELLRESAMDLACRSFPEEDSPFASDKPLLEGLNKCEDGETCQCSYKKVTTTDGDNKYYNTNTTKPFPDNTKSIIDLTGWTGYCAAWDEETKDPNGNPVCLTWWPVDVIKSGINIFDNHPEAGFTAGGPQYYCLAAKGNKINSAGQGLVTEKFDKNNYFVKVNDFAGNFDKTPDNAWPLWRLVDKSGFFSSFVSFASGGLLGGLADKVFGKDKALAGWSGNSGLLQFKVKSASNPTSTLPLSNLREYDIESIVLKVTGKDANDWPAANEEFYLRRDGFAKSTSSSPETTDRWTALWCGGEGEERCEFNDVYTWEKFKPLIVDPAPDCGDGKIGNTNLFAMRARFADDKGQAGDWGESYQPYQFLGFEGGLCDATKEKGWVSFDVIFQLREWCTTVAVVNQSGENKAWTGRLNQKSVTSDQFSGLYNAENEPEQLTIRGGVGLDYKYSQDKAPFGAIVPPGPTIYLPEQWDARKDEALPDEAAGEKEIKILEPGKQPLYVEADRKQVRAGSPYSCPGSDKCVIPPTDKGVTLKQSGPEDANSLGRAVSYLQQLFAKVYNIWQWDGNAAGYQENNDLLADRRDLITKANGWPGECPVIQALNQTEKNTIGAGDCRQAAYRGAYAVKGRTINTVSSSDKTISPSFAPVESKVGEEVALQFYAYNSNGEQLPLRKIEIDWNDGVKTAVSGSFKNHKPICNNASANYGDTSQACEANMFEFKHVYAKTGSFIPGVTVWDNWGRFTIARYESPGGNKGVITVEQPQAINFFTESAGSDAVDIITPNLTSDFGWQAQWRNTGSSRTKLATMAEMETFKIVKTVARDERPIDYGQHKSRDGLPDGIGAGYEWFGVTWTGILKIDVAGDYKFKLTSDDGSDLFINDSQVINNTGDHGTKSVESDAVNLFQGNHKAVARFYNNTRGWGVKLEWQKPGSTTYEIVPLSNMLALGTRLDPPPIPGRWSNWSTCTASCGGGTETRNCNNPAPAKGGDQCLKEDDSRSLTETKNCNTQPCPPPYDFSLSNSGNVTVAPGGSGTATITVTRVSGTVPSISLEANVSGSVSGGITGSLNPNRCTPNPTCSVSFDISVSASTPSGSRPTLIVSSGSKSTSFTIIVP